MTSEANQNTEILKLKNEDAEENNNDTFKIISKYKKNSELLSIEKSLPKELFKLPEINLHSKLSQNFEKQALKLTELIEKNPVNDKLNTLDRKVEKLGDKIDKIESALKMVVGFIHKNFLESNHEITIEARLKRLEEKIELTKKFEEDFDIIEKSIKNHSTDHECEDCKKPALKYICSGNSFDAQKNRIAIKYYRCAQCGHVCTLQK